MEHLVLILVAALTLIGAAFSKLLADEFKSWAPWLVSSILAVAVRTLPPSRRERCEEEWKSHVDTLPGDLSKLIVACGFVFAAWRIAAEPLLVTKRAVDIAMAFSGIVLLAPLLIIASVATVATSRGPVLFRHRRMGRHGKPIELLKFRTMVTDAPERLRRLPDSDPAAASEWGTNRKLRDDPRLTKVGRILRALGLDELPQLFHVLKGDMSMVGPVAVTEEVIKKLAAPDDDYAVCRPGLVGIFRPGRDAESIAAYVRGWSLMLDVKILLIAVGGGPSPDGWDADLRRGLRRLAFHLLFAVGLMALLILLSAPMFCRL
jgi:exopolysaccharide production protein ExoY